MVKTLIGAIATGVAAALLVPIMPPMAAAQQPRNYPWCSTANSSTGSVCAFTSFEQCRQSAKLCEQNPAYYDGSAYAADPYAAAPRRVNRHNRLRK
jgi:hypothetical protein